jgi:MSHA pilin protein MshD
MKMFDCHIARSARQGDQHVNNRFGVFRTGTGAHPYGGNAGVTLIELIVAMVVISIALTGILLVINYTTRNSADPVLRHQAIAIAEAYMEEITLRNYNDPDDGLLCPTPEANRALYDNVCDYNGLSNNGAVDQNGNAFAGLGNYTVNVVVAPQPYGPAGLPVNGLRIDVTVTDSGGQNLTLTGFRANY